MADLEIFHSPNWYCVIYPLNWLWFFIRDKKAVDVFEHPYLEDNNLLNLKSGISFWKSYNFLE